VELGLRLVRDCREAGKGRGEGWACRSDGCDCAFLVVVGDLSDLIRDDGFKQA